MRAGEIRRGVLRSQLCHADRDSTHSSIVMQASWFLSEGILPSAVHNIHNAIQGNTIQYSTFSVLKMSLDFHILTKPISFEQTGTVEFKE